ncbi:MAG TPA: hypothetical protein VHF89_07620 [Solirubrobacteraceae bacterium]|nr:hypothetical protein [Solirubrobacteraceae bacterium]
MTVDTRDRAIVNDVIQALQPADVEEWEPTRDPLTVLAVSAAVAELATALIALREKWRDRGGAATVVVKTEDGRTIEITGATPEQIHMLLHGPGAGGASAPHG